MASVAHQPGEPHGYLTLNPLDLVASVRRNNITKMRAVRLSMVILDALMIGLAFWAAYKIRFVAPTSALFDPRGAASNQFYESTAFLLIPVWLLLFYLFRLYDPASILVGQQEYAHVFNACTAGIMVVIMAIFLDPTLAIARGWILLSWVLAVVTICVTRFSMRRVIFWLRNRGHFVAPTYIVGANAEGIAIAEQLVGNYMTGVNIIGFLDDNLPIGEEVVPGIVVHGPTNRAVDLVDRFGVERLIVATSGIHRVNMIDMFRNFTNNDQVSIWLSSGMYEILTTGVQVQDVGAVPMVSVNRVRLTGANIILKGILDYVGAFLGLLVLSPVFLVIAIIMRRTDPGPIIYRRRVVGVNGKEFDAFKFRTMVVNSQQVLDELLARDPEARAEYEQYYKLKVDPRITRIGNFLRKTSIDELPQLLNVLRGEMSLVGPRMITKAEVEKYGRWGLNLLTVKPGITGLWQVSGRSELTYEERVRLDMRYIRNYSIWLDLQIIFQTIPSVLMSKGAY
ncbi:MAG TPA: sugar transferase [Aggregatilineales bacterium]|nr:sugar transferase [Aggregatilineales bacterium]